MFLLDLKYKGKIGYFLSRMIYGVFRYLKYDRKDDETYLTELFKRRQGYPLNLEDPTSFNEKLQWLKIHERKPIYTTFSDKYALREYVKENIGEELLIPLLYTTENYNDIRPENLPDVPFILKTNHDSGSYKIVRDKTKVDWKKLRVDCKWWMSLNYYWFEREWQYKNIVPRIIIEELLVDKSGKIPNDYKIHCINGEVEFIYVSIDREGKNKRNIYDKNWNPLHFTWASKSKDISKLRGEEILPPSTFDRMTTIAKEIAKQYAYVRVDFYDVDGKLYFGEITQCHGGGFDQILPIEWDYHFGRILKIK
jgi:hypothetical protein